MIPKVIPLFVENPAQGKESFSTLLQGRQFKLEHIVSRGEASPSDFWYDQAQDEWVALIAGQATLNFEHGNIELKAGEAVLIPAHLKHRVSYTSVDAVWLAIHFEAEA